MTEELTYNKIFDLMDCRYAKKNVLYEHLHNSYNDLVIQIINYLDKNKNIFEESRVGDKLYRYRFKYENIHVRPPLNENGDSLMYPMDAIERNSTYSIKFIAKISQIQEIYDLTKREIISEINLGSYDKEVAVIIPNMVHSKYCSLQINKDYTQRECPLNPGGYFVVNGAEKIVLSLEKMVENKPLVFVKKDAGINNYEVKINSRSNDPNIIPQGIQIKLKKNFDITIKVPILNEVSVFVLMRALGLETDKEIVKYIVYNENDIDMLNILKIAVDLSKKEGKKLILTKEDAYYSLTNKLRVVKKYIDKDKKLQYEEKKEHLEALLRNAFLPHINSDRFDNVLKVKGIFLGYMINKLLNCFLGRTKPDDRDSFVNKRVDMPGDLIFDLFKQYYKKMLNECNKFFKKRSGSNHDTPLLIINQIKPSIIEQGIKSAMLTGNWGKKKGVAQMFPRLTYLQSISFLRRVDAPSADASASKLTGPRHYHPSQAGFLCLTGDTEILMSDGTIKLIKDVKNGDSVISVDKETMKEISTPIHNWFKKDCDKLLKLTTITGRTIKCTPEHKLLTKVGDKYDFVEVQNMKEGDYLISRKLLESEITPNIIKINDIAFLTPIKSIEEIPAEPVYDFETKYFTHSFVANSIYTKNCSVESPEHANIGLVKHLTMLSSITIGSSDQSNILHDMITTNKYFIHMNNHSTLDLAETTKIFLNGEWLGFTKNPLEIYKELRTLKTNSIINRTNGIVYDIPRGEIKVYTESGRLYRPIMTVKDNNLILSPKMIDEFFKDKKITNLNKWDMLMMKYPEAIDIMDCEEQYYSLIARSLKEVYQMKSREKNVIPDSLEPIVNRYDDTMILNYTHCEFHPSMMIGIISANIPFANHNAAARNIFSFAQMKQAMGWYTTNYRDRADISYILYHTQKPLVNTKLSKYIHTDILPCGENAVVMAGCYTGHNQDDSIVFNQTAIDRGLFRSASLKKWSSKIEKNQSTSQDDIFMKPDQSKLAGTRHAVYDKLNDKGYVPEETTVVNGDVIIGKVTPIQPAPGSNKCYKDSSEIYKSGEPAIIDKVFLTTDSEGSDMIKMRTRSIRIPKIGDKFCILLNTDVLTSEGWIKLKDITINHKIASLVDGHKLEYVAPIDIYRFNYKGKMYKVCSQQVELDVTLDHELYVKKRNHTDFELVKASEMIGKRYKFKKNCEIYEKNEYSTIDIDGNIVDYDAYLILLGIFIADGCLNKNSDTQIIISGEKQRKIEQLINVCEILKVKLNLGKTPSGSHLNTLNLGLHHTINSKKLYSLFKKLNVGALNKFLPKYVWDLPMKQARILLESLISCDGSHNKQGSVCYYTSSKQLADDVMKLAIHAGWSGSIKTIRSEGTPYEINCNRSHSKGTLNADALSVRIIKTKNEPEMNHGHVHQQDGQNEEIYDYEGEVGCLEVPSHVFMVRQNGKNVWIGNCSRHGRN